MISVIITAFISFISTNIDNIFILMVLFAQINESMQKRHIILGQYIGTMVLFIVSVLGAYGLNLVPPQYTGLLGLVPILLGIKEWIKYREEKRLIAKEDEEDVVVKEVRGKSKLSKLIHPAIVNVFLITIASGADNIGIYIPVFVRLNVLELIITLIIFLLLLALWCFAGERLTNFPVIKKTIQKYKNIGLPFVYIMIGVIILTSSDVFTLFR